MASGRPVGSKTLTERYHVGVRGHQKRWPSWSSGFVQQLHTSGGAPTDRGYRYYVHHLMGSPELPSDQIMIRLVRQVELDQWVDFAASVLAETAGTRS